MSTRKPLVALQCSFAPAGCEFVTVNPSGRCLDHPKTGKTPRQRTWEPAYSVSRASLSRREAWKVGFDLHCVDGPAERVYVPADATTPRSEKWSRHGRLHRIGGPATRRVSADYVIETFAIDGAELSVEAYFSALSHLSEEALGSLLVGHDEVLAAGASPRKVLAAVEAGLRTPAGIAAVAIDDAPTEWARAFEQASE